MTATRVVENVTVEQLTVEAAAVEQPQPAEKPVKEKKPRAPKEKKPKTAKTAAHPPYFQMIKEALLALNEKSGLSPYAIAKHMEEKHKEVLPSNFRKILGLQLKNSAEKGKLIKVKASYRLSDSGNKDEKKGTTKAAKKPQRSKITATKKSEAVKKAAKPVRKTKRSAPVKAKQPRSIKAPAAKKAKKAAV